MADKFVHLHLHTEYSLVDGLIRIKPLMKAVAAAGMPAVALTDYCNLFALVKFYRAAIGAGIKPIIGVDAELRGLSREDPAYRVVLLCKDEQGYRNLTRLITRAYLEGQHGSGPVLERDWLIEARGGLIALSGAQDGDLGRALVDGNQERTAQYLAFWRRHFPDHYYLELRRTGRAGDEDHLRAAVELAAAEGLPVVATNDVRFLRPEDHAAHEVRVCIHEGRVLNDPRRPRGYSEQQALRSPEEMEALFADIPEAIENSVEIAKRCNVSLRFGKNVLPAFPIPAELSEERYFREQAREGLDRRLAALVPTAGETADQIRTRYLERLETELEVITQMGFPGYFLIVADFIRWAKENGIPVGPGRGSGAGSLVAYALLITDVDPLRYELLFERFLNPERVSMPDFDVDFCMEGRDRVIEYVAERYGRERVSQIITYGSMAAKAVVRDVGRVLGHPYGFVDRIAKLIPFEIGMTLDKALHQEPDLKRAFDEEEDVHAVIEMARSLEGLARNAGKHAGGVVISPSQLTDFTPLYCEAGGQSVVTQLDKDDVESIGLVKFDFLGLRTLTIIDWAVAIANRRRAQQDRPPIVLDQIPLDDPQAFELLQEQQTTAVFQLESRGIKEIIKRLRPDNFEDIVALVALYRPGPLQSGMVDDFILRKHGQAKVEYPHPDLEPILRPTYGVILYQEQVMQIAQVLAGYTLGGADLLRRAMGKKKVEEMAKQREIFLKGATERGVEEATANYIFDLMEKFAGYGFNKSHSVAYALLSYQTAWLKAHEPAAFMAAVLSADMDNTDKVVTLIEECRAIGLEVRPPDINRSQYRFTVPDEQTILYGLGAIKGVGHAAIEGLLTERGAGGPYADLDELCLRGAAQKLNRRVLESLIRAGALDGLGPNRATLIHHLPQSIRRAEQRQRDRSAGQEDLFGTLTTGEGTPGVPMETLPEWDDELRLSAEKETLGLYLTGHPFMRYEAELLRLTGPRISGLSAERDGPGGRPGPRSRQFAIVAGLVVDLRTRVTQRGRIAFLTLDDGSGRLEVGVFGEDHQRFAHLLARDQILVIEGQLGVDDYTGNLRVRATEVMDVDQARMAYARRLELSIGGGQGHGSVVRAIHEALAPYRPGACTVRITYTNERATARLDLGTEWWIRPEGALLSRLQALEGVERAELVFGRGSRKEPRRLECDMA